MNEQLKNVLRTIPRQHQRQDSTADQLKDLLDFANKLGMYDAADIIKHLLRKSDSL